jgi:IS5 family transposase
MYKIRCSGVPLFKIKNLIDAIDQDHPLIILAKKFDWPRIEIGLCNYYAYNEGRPGYPIRLMVALQILKYIYNLSDENLIKSWRENIYFQAFTGNSDIHLNGPCDRTLLSKFRARIGEKGANFILRESVLIFGPEVLDCLDRSVIIDSTVQEKYIKYPTDIKLALDVIYRLWSLGKNFGIKYRVKHGNEVKLLRKQAAFNKSNTKYEVKADVLKKLRHIGLELLDELKRKIIMLNKDNNELDEMFNIYYRAITQEKTDHGKVYSIYEPQVKCIAKGKAHKKWEFGSKVSMIIGTYNHIIYYIECLEENIHDSKTIEPALNKLQDLYGITPSEIIGDQGYRGKKQYGDTNIIFPHKNISKLPEYEQEIILSQLNRRSDIEEVNSHLKNDTPFGRNNLKGIIGDKINPIYSAIAHNLKLFARNILEKTKLKVKNANRRLRKQRLSSLGLRKLRQIRRIDPEYNLFIYKGVT